MYKLPKVELENITKLYDKLKKIQSEQPKEMNEVIREKSLDKLGLWLISG